MRLDFEGAPEDSEDAWRLVSRPLVLDSVGASQWEIYGETLPFGKGNFSLEMYPDAPFMGLFT